MANKTLSYDLDTKHGLAASVRWLNTFLNQIADGGVWMVPRSGTSYVVRHSDKSVIKVTAALPDPSLDRVFRAAGWKVVDNT
jgi:hypothetical protein